jgi:predicted acetyltransferase
VLEDADAPAFYAAARTISVSLDRENLDWQRLLAELQTECSRDRQLSRSRILTAHKP